MSDGAAPETRSGQRRERERRRRARRVRFAVNGIALAPVLAGSFLVVGARSAAPVLPPAAPVPAPVAPTMSPAVRPPAGERPGHHPSGGGSTITQVRDERPGADPTRPPDAPLPGSGGPGPGARQPVAQVDPGARTAGSTTAAAGSLQSRVPRPCAGTGSPSICLDDLGIAAPVSAARVSHGELQMPDDPGRAVIAQSAAPIDARQGASVVAAHVWQRGRPGAFARLAEAAPGMTITLADGQGREQRFRVRGIRLVRPHEVARQDFWRADGPRRLVLVTCAGPVVPERDGAGRTVWGYEHRLVVEADAVGG